MNSTSLTFPGYENIDQKEYEIGLQKSLKKVRKIFDIGGKGYSTVALFATPNFQVNVNYMNMVFSMCVRDMLAVDIDFLSEKWTLQETKEALQNIQSFCDYMKNEQKLDLLFRIFRTDKGIHAILVNHRISSDSPIATQIQATMGSDPYYVAFSRITGFCLRIGPKLYRKVQGESLKGKDLENQVKNEVVSVDYEPQQYVGYGEPLPYIQNILNIKNTLTKFIKNEYRNRYYDMVKFRFIPYIDGIRRCPPVTFFNELEFIVRDLYMKTMTEEEGEFIYKIEHKFDFRTMIPIYRQDDISLQYDPYTMVWICALLGVSVFTFPLKTAEDLLEANRILSSFVQMYSVSFLTYIDEDQNLKAIYFDAHTEREQTKLQKVTSPKTELEDLSIMVELKEEQKQEELEEQKQEELEEQKQEEQKQEKPKGKSKKKLEISKGNIAKFIEGKLYALDMNIIVENYLALRVSPLVSQIEGVFAIDDITVPSFFKTVFDYPPIGTLLPQSKEIIQIIFNTREYFTSYYKQNITTILKKRTARQKVQPFYGPSNEELQRVKNDFINILLEKRSLLEERTRTDYVQSFRYWDILDEKERKACNIPLYVVKNIAKRCKMIIQKSITQNTIYYGGPYFPFVFAQAAFKKMIFLTSPDILMLDWDTTETFTKQKAISILNRFVASHAALPEREKLFYTEPSFAIYETDNGIHAFLVSHHVMCTSEIASRIIMETCSDLTYAGMTKFNGFSVRMSPKIYITGDTLMEPEDVKKQFIQKSGYKTGRKTVYIVGDGAIDPYIMKYVKAIYNTQRYIMSGNYEDIYNTILLSKEENIKTWGAFFVQQYSKLPQRQNKLEHARNCEWAANYGTTEFVLNVVV